MYVVKVIDEAQEDIDKMDGSIRIQVLAGIRKVSKNPLPKNEGGYGTPLGNKDGNNLTGFFKIKFRDISIRVVYTLVRSEQVMNIIVVSDREDNKSYKLAQKRRYKYGENLFQDKFKTPSE